MEYDPTDVIVNDDGFGRHGGIDLRYSVCCCVRVGVELLDFDVNCNDADNR